MPEGREYWSFAKFSPGAVEEGTGMVGGRESKIESNPCCSASARLRAECAATADAGTACAVPWYVLNGDRGEWGATNDRAEQRKAVVR